MKEEQETKEQTQKEQEVAATLRNEIAAEVFEGKSAPVEDKERESQQEQQEEQEEQEELEEQENDDPWAGVSPKLKESFESMASKLNDYEAMAARLKQTENRIGAIQNKLYAAEQKAAAAPAQPTQKEIKDAAKSEESWESLKEDFPEWAEAIDLRLAAENAKIAQKQQIMASQQIMAAKMVENKINALQDEVKRAKELTKLEIHYPDYQQIIVTREYQDWLAKQPDSIKQLTQSERATDAIKVLDSFSRANGSQTQGKRKQRLERSISRIPGKTARPAKAESDMSIAELRRKVAAEVWAE